MFENYYDYILEEVTKQEITSIPIIEKKLDQNLINKYKDKHPTLKRIRINEDTKGIALFSKNNLVGIINVDTKRKYILGLEVFKPFKGQGISYKLLDIATKKLGANKLSVRKTNRIALTTYKKDGWRIESEDNYMYYMVK